MKPPSPFTPLSMKISTPALPPFVDLETAARMANVTRRTVQNKLASGQIPPKSVKMKGRLKTVSVAALESLFGPLKPPSDVSPPKDEGQGEIHGSFHEAAELRARLTAKDEIISSLQATLDHERKDREHERENWRVALRESQANLLAAQDTPTARALAGAPKESAIVVSSVAPQPEPRKPKPRREKKAASPWWQSLFAN
ncbi:MAG: hypothetical protein HQL45_16475 [Alphaproteobacteria bacterium]|nr:hypothetical protein [Alphaproteobacteria bacterium]